MTLQNDLHAALNALQSAHHKSALKAAKVGMAKHKSHPAFPNIYGIALCGMGRHRDSINHFKKALRLDPGFQDARKNLAQTLIVIGMAEPALGLLEQVVSKTEKDADAWYLLAQAHQKTGDAAAAEQAVDKSISLAPKQARAYNLRALLYTDRGQTNAALADFEAALRLAPNDVETLTNISMPLARQMRHDEAMKAIERAVALMPTHVGARLRLATQLVETGQTDRAIEEFHQVLTLNPAEPNAIEQLVALQTSKQNDALLPTIQTALKKAPKNSEANASLSFALARVWEQQHDPDKAARYLAEANRTMAARMPYDAQRDDALNAAILERFPEPMILLPTTATTEPRPIYVIGLPRSGTTLTEAVLGGHPNVAALGERIEPARFLYPLIESDAPFDPVEFARTDTELLPDLPDGTTAYVDKMPENYRLVGFLKAAYPHARIIHLRRDPRDVALSMWRGHFQGRALSYTYDLQAMAHRFNLYAETMAHWHRVLPGHILDLRYEELVADVSAASQKIARWCDLDWSAAMARPDLSTDQVLTLSASQLRQPVHTRSVGKWRQHETMLAPFIDGLNPDLWPELGAT